MDVLIACETSGIVRDAFITAGHNAVSVDILPTDSPGPHITGDALNVLGQGWDLMIAHPPCTYMSNSGVQHLRRDATRWNKLNAAADFFNALLDADIPRICIENPIMHKYALERIGNRKYDQIIQPYQFGHMEQKATCLWLKGLFRLTPTSDLKTKTMQLPDSQRQRIFWASPGPERWKVRSMTYTGIARAMAEQWG